MPKSDTNQIDLSRGNTQYYTEKQNIILYKKILQTDHLTVINFPSHSKHGIIDK